MQTTATRVLAAPWLWVGLVIVATVVVAVAYVLRISQYLVMPDELGYMKQAVHFAEHLSPSMRGDHWFNSYAQLGPLLFAPAYGLFSTPTAFDAGHVISAVVFSTTAIPIFLLTRSVTRDDAAGVLAAALGVAIPWLAMTATLMTEPIAYPALAWALLAMTRALERPHWRRDAVALLAILVAVLARTQLVLLGPAFLLAAIVLQLTPREAGGARMRASAALRAHWLLAAAVAAGALALASPGTRSALLGSYAGPLSGDLLPSGTWGAGREMLAYVVVGIGGLPLALAAVWTALTLASPASARARAFAAVALCTGVLLVVVAGAFTAGHTAYINDRYLFFVVPILVVAGVAMLVERRPATLALVVAGVLVGALIAVSDLAQAGPSLIAPSQTFHQVLLGRTRELAGYLGLETLSMPLLVGAAVAVATAAVALARRRWPARTVGLAIGAALLLANVVQTGYTLHSIGRTQAGVSPVFLAGRDWLDREVPGDAPIGAVVGTMFEPSSTPPAWWDLTFWSKRLDRLYRLPGAARDAQAFGTVISLDERTGRLSGLDDRDLIVTTGEEKRFRLRGAEAVVAKNGFVVWRAPRPYRAAWSLAAQTDIGDIRVGQHGELRVFGDGSAGRRQVTLTVTPSPYSGQGYTLRARAGDAVRQVRVPLGKSRVVRLPLELPASGPATVRLDVLDRDPVDGAPVTGLKIAQVAITPA